jgi:hypothetical protein
LPNYFPASPLQFGLWQRRRPLREFENGYVNELETAVASGERDPSKIEAFEVTPVEASAAGKEKPASRETSGPGAFSVVDKLKFVGR